MIPTRSVETTPGLALGTVGYVSPEPVRGLSTDHRSDLFRLGAVLHEMLAGRRAFAGDTAADTISAVLNTDPEWTSGREVITPALHRVVHHCLEKDVRRRFQSARDVTFALEGLNAPSTPTAVAAGRRSPRHRSTVGSWLCSASPCSEAPSSGGRSARGIRARAPLGRLGSVGAG